jgi:hypothetical protein
VSRSLPHHGGRRPKVLSTAREWNHSFPKDVD